MLQLFGAYVGTVKTSGLRWVNPFYGKTRMSVRASSFESARLKVNDKEGNPIEIGAIIVVQVKDTAQASFSVDDYNGYVRTQAEASLRNLASRHPYDAHDSELSIRRNPSEMAIELRKERRSGSPGQSKTAVTVFNRFSRGGRRRPRGGVPRRTRS